MENRGDNRIQNLSTEVKNVFFGQKTHEITTIPEVKSIYEHASIDDSSRTMTKEQGLKCQTSSVHKVVFHIIIALCYAFKSIHGKIFLL